MIFGKKRTLAQDMFDKAFATLPDKIKHRVAFQICFYDYLLHVINETIIPRIVLDTGFARTTMMVDIAFHNIVRSLKMDNFHEYPILQIAHNPNINEPIKSYKTDLLLYFTNRDNNDIKSVKKIDEEIVREEDWISFLQMMTQVYATNGKEFQESDYSKYKGLFQEYSSIVNAFFTGSMKGLGGIDPNIVIKKALKTINTLSEVTVALIATKAAALKLKYG